VELTCSLCVWHTFYLWYVPGAIDVLLSSSSRTSTNIPGVDEPYFIR
jgi:hypothetical protein